MIDSIISQGGQDVFLVSLTTPAYDDNDDLDLAACEFTCSVIKAVTSAPSDRRYRGEEGDGQSGTKRASVLTSIDVRDDRTGKRDRLVVPARGAIISVSGTPSTGWTFTVDSDTDVVSFISGYLTVTNSTVEVYEVTDVKPSSHPFAVGLSKKTLNLKKVTGR